MKILQITKYYYPNVSFGGPVQCSRNISKYMIKQGHEVTVYATDAGHMSNNSRVKERSQIIDRAKVYFFPNMSRTFGFFISPGMVGALRKNLRDFDVVHLHEFRTFQNLAYYYSRKNDSPYALTLHGELEYSQQLAETGLLRELFNKAFGEKLLKNARKVIALTEVEEQQLVQRKVAKDRIAIIPNALDLEDFSNPPPKGYFRNMFGINNEDIILYLGRINPYKGLDALVKAFSLMENTRDLKLVLAGPDDNFASELRKMISALKLEDKVLFTGSIGRKEVLGAFTDASLVVYASLQEGFPMVPLEAGIMGKAIIVSKHPSMDFVRKGEFGLTVDYGNAQQLRVAIETILADNGLAKKLGANGKKFVEANYSWVTIGKVIENIYMEIMK